MDGQRTGVIGKSKFTFQETLQVDCTDYKKANKLEGSLYLQKIARQLSPGCLKACALQVRHCGTWAVLICAENGWKWQQLMPTFLRLSANSSHFMPKPRQPKESVSLEAHNHPGSPGRCLSWRAIVCTPTDASMSFKASSLPSLCIHSTVNEWFLSSVFLNCNVLWKPLNVGGCRRLSTDTYKLPYITRGASLTKSVAGGIRSL